MKALLGPKQSELLALAKSINAREETIAAARRRTHEAANAWVCEVVLQGQALNKAKASLTHGMWMDWLRIHCPTISQWTANAYMRVASNWDSGEDGLDEATSLRAALSLCAKEEKEEKVPKSFPPYLDAIGRMAKLSQFCVKHPVGDWPKAGLAQARTTLAPVAKLLWPNLEFEP